MYGDAARGIYHVVHPGAPQVSLLKFCRNNEKNTDELSLSPRANFAGVERLPPPLESDMHSDDEGALCYGGAAAAATTTYMYTTAASGRSESPVAPPN